MSTANNNGSKNKADITEWLLTDNYCSKYSTALTHLSFTINI